MRTKLPAPIVRISPRALLLPSGRLNRRSLAARAA